MEQDLTRPEPVYNGEIIRMDRISKVHGAGGISTSNLIEEVFRTAFSNIYLDELTDSCIVPGAERLALTTDSFVVRPIFFPGGDIGRIAVCGTVNDMLMCGARPVYLTAGYILEEGLAIEDLNRIAVSMAEAAKEAGVQIVTGDTKTVEPADPKEPGLIINTSGVGFVGENVDISPEKIKCGDAVILSGNLGDHHAAILGSRMSIKNHIVSDNAPLTEMVTRLMDNGIHIHAMRDVTRGGLATILNEISDASGQHIVIEEACIPVSGEVAEFSKLLGLDPLYMGNEGKCVFFLPREDTKKALDIIKNSKYGSDACIIGGVNSDEAGVTLKTSIGGEKIITPLYGEGLPRIC